MRGDLRTGILGSAQMVMRAESRLVDETGPPEFLAGGGVMGAMMRAKDWAATPLGPTEFWPQSLRTTVSTCLNCSFPILVWWGPKLVKLYNDAYMALIADKHPRALGSAGREVWPEIWDIVGPDAGCGHGPQRGGPGA